MLKCANMRPLIFAVRNTHPIIISDQIFCVQNFQVHRLAVGLLVNGRSELQNLFQSKLLTDAETYTHVIMSAVPST